jgi:hypothetical protein
LRDWLMSDLLFWGVIGACHTWLLPVIVPLRVRVQAQAAGAIQPAEDDAAAAGPGEA